MLIGAVAGGLLAFFQYKGSGVFQTASVISSDAGPETFSARVPSKDETKEREERIASLRDALKNRTLAISAAPPEEVEEVIATEESVEEAVLEEELRCDDFAAFGGVWDSRGLKVSEREGVRQVYRETVLGTSTVPTKTVLLELPLRSKPAGQTCISSDVVAISINGALIRNTDARAYAGTPPERLIGYTLDGFPLYGGLSVAPDVCGGAVVSGQYRYGLSLERDTVLRCFVANPVAL